MTSDLGETQGNHDHSYLEQKVKGSELRNSMVKGCLYEPLRGPLRLLGQCACIAL